MCSRRLFTILLIILLLGVFAPLIAGGWSGGYRVAVDGYNSSAFANREYLVLSVIHEPFKSLPVHPHVQFGILVPTFFSDAVHTQVIVGFGSGLLVMQEHPFERFFRRDSALVPRVEASISYDFSQNRIASGSFIVQPLSFHYGDKYIGVLGATVIRDFSNDSWGWGIRLFEISHYLW